MTRLRILVIAGSVRQHRVSPAIAAWVAQLGGGVLGDGATLEVVDLRDWPLAMDVEPDVPAAAAAYSSPVTRGWSDKVAVADAIVFVTPQYNWGYPAALKNAIDHLYREWAGKPALIVTYGGHGGDKCAAQLRQVLTAIKMKPVEAMPELTLPRAVIEANSGEIDPATLFADAADAVEAGFAALVAG